MPPFVVYVDIFLITGKVKCLLCFFGYSGSACEYIFCCFFDRVLVFSLLIGVSSLYIWVLILCYGDIYRVFVFSLVWGGVAD